MGRKGKQNQGNPKIKYKSVSTSDTTDNVETISKHPPLQPQGPDNHQYSIGPPTPKYVQKPSWSMSLTMWLTPSPASTLPLQK